MPTLRSSLLPSCGVLFAAGLWACGPTVPPLPAPLPDPHQLSPRPGDASRGRALLHQPGRRGFACGDCHPTAPGGPIRPAPSLIGLPTRGGPFWGGRAANPAAAIGLCIERHQGQPAPTDDTVPDLLAALAEPSPAPPPARDPYDQACRHCHEDGPAPALLGRPWPAAVVNRVIRGPRAMAPDHRMPTFSLDSLDDETLAELVSRLARVGPVGKPAGE